MHLTDIQVKCTQCTHKINPYISTTEDSTQASINIELNIDIQLNIDSVHTNTEVK